MFSVEPAVPAPPKPQTPKSASVVLHLKNTWEHLASCASTGTTPWDFSFHLSFFRPAGFSCCAGAGRDAQLSWQEQQIPLYVLLTWNIWITLNLARAADEVSFGISLGMLDVDQVTELFHRNIS